MSDARNVILEQIRAERERQPATIGTNPNCTWVRLLDEHLARAMASSGDDWRHRMVVIAALAVAAIEDHDARSR